MMVMVMVMNRWWRMGSSQQRRDESCCGQSGLESRLMRDTVRVEMSDRVVWFGSRRDENRSGKGIPVDLPSSIYSFWPVRAYCEDNG